MPELPDIAPDIAADRLQTPLMRVSANGRIDYLNPAAAAWLGLSARRLVGQPVTQLDAQPLSLPQLMRQALQGGRPVHARRLQIDTMAGRRFADAWASPLDDDGLRLEFHPTDEFPGEDPATLLPMALSTALAGLAHELRNPLAGLAGAAQLLARRIDDEELGRAKEYAAGSFPIGLATKSDVAEALLDAEAAGYGVDYIETRGNVLRAQDEPAVEAVSAKFANPDRLVIVMAGSFGSE